MSDSSSFTHKAHVFDGKNYSAWEVKMKFYLRSFDLWDVTESDVEIPELRANPTLAQMKQHSDMIAKKHRALSFLHTVVTDEMFNMIMTCETAKQAWDTLAEEFHGDQQARQMEVLNLKREMALSRMKEGEYVKEFSDRVMNVVNQIRMLGVELKDAAVVEKILISLPEKFEAKISSLEDSKDLTNHYKKLGI